MANVTMPLIDVCTHQVISIVLDLYSTLRHKLQKRKDVVINLQYNMKTLNIIYLKCHTE